MRSAHYISAEDNGRKEHPLGYGHDANKMLKRFARNICIQCAMWAYGDRLKGVARFSLSLCCDNCGPDRVFKEREHPGEGRTMRSACVRVHMTNKSHAVERAP